MKMICKHLQDENVCALLSKAMGNPNHVPDIFCEKFCSPTDKDKQAKMLARYGKPSKDIKVIVSKEHEAQQAALKDLPSGFQIAKNLKRHTVQIAIHYRTTGELYVTEERKQARENICKNCPSKKMVIKDGVMRCTVKTCGCYIDNPKDRKILKGKAEYIALDCDLKHWSEQGL